jgi:hypothetical protein
MNTSDGKKRLALERGAQRLITKPPEQTTISAAAISSIHRMLDRSMKA